MSALRDAILRAILEEPDSDLHRLAFADLLEDGGGRVCSPTESVGEVVFTSPRAPLASTRPRLPGGTLHSRRCRQLAA